MVEHNSHNSLGDKTENQTRPSLIAGLLNKLNRVPSMKELATKRLIPVLLAGGIAVSLASCDSGVKPDDSTTPEDSITDSEVTEREDSVGVNIDYDSEEMLALKAQWDEYQKTNPNECSNKGSIYNLTLPTYYESLNFSEWDIQNNTYATSMAVDTDNNVYIFLKGITEGRNTPLHIKSETDFPFFYNLQSLVCFKNVNNSTINALFGEDEFVRWTTLHAMEKTIPYEVVGEGFVYYNIGTSIKQKNFVSGYHGDVYSEAPICNEDETMWYILCDDPEKPIIYIYKNPLTQEEIEENNGIEKALEGFDFEYRNINLGYKGENKDIGEKIILKNYRITPNLDYGDYIYEDSSNVNEYQQ